MIVDDEFSSVGDPWERGYPEPNKSLAQAKNSPMAFKKRMQERWAGELRRGSQVRAS